MQLPEPPQSQIYVMVKMCLSGKPLTHFATKEPLVQPIEPCVEFGELGVHVKLDVAQLARDEFESARLLRNPCLGKLHAPLEIGKLFRRDLYRHRASPLRRPI